MKLRLCMTVLAATLAVAGCSSDETGDETGTGGTGNEGGAGVGATGGTSSEGGGPGVGGSGNAGGDGTGGSADCFTCAAYITECVASDAPPPECDTQDTCPGESTDLFNDLAECACTECAEECVETCAGGMAEEPDCGPCQMGAIGGACAAQFGACSGDA